MSHFIPVFYIPIKFAEIPNSLTSWHSVEEILSESWEKRIENGVRISSSRNWWFQHSLSLICKDLKMNGLDFLLQEIVCLKNDDLKLAQNTLEIIISQIKSGIPPLSKTSEEEGSIWGLRYYYENKKPKKYSKKELEKAFEEAQPLNEIGNGEDIGYKSIVDFYSFIKSLLEIINLSLEFQ